MSDRSRRPPLTPTLIAETAKELFSTRGYANTSIEDIADRLGVRKGAVYYHVQRKSDLLVEVIAGLVRPIASRVEQIADSSAEPWAQLSEAVDNHVRQLLANQQAARVFFEQYRDIPAAHTEFAELAHRIESAFDRVIAGGTARGDFRTASAPLLRMHVLALCNWPYRWFDPRGSYSIDDVADSVWQQVATLVRTVTPTLAHTQIPNRSQEDA